MKVSIPSGQVAPEDVASGELDGFFESPEDAPPKRLLVIRAYLDETGHESKDFVLVCGHGGHKHQWAGLLGEWLDCLGPQKTWLHMHDLRWNEGTRKLLARLGPLPDKHGLKRIVGGVKVSDYEDLIIGTAAEKLLKGYMAALTAAVLCALFATPQDERLELVFEEQKEYESRIGMALSAFATLPDKRLYARNGKPKLARWSFIPKGTTVLLDQADYLCYAMLQKCKDDSSERAQWCRPILGDGTYIGKIMNRKEARQTVNEALKIAGKGEVNDANAKGETAQ